MLMVHFAFDLAGMTIEAPESPAGRFYAVRCDSSSVMRT